MQAFGSKQPFEEYFIKFDFSEDISASDSVASGSVTIIDTADDSSTASTMLDNTKDYADGDDYYVWIKGGTDGHVYQITCKITTTVLGEKYELDGILPVREY